MKPKRLAATDQILQFYLIGLSRLQIVVVLHFATIRNFEHIADIVFDIICKVVYLHFKLI